MLLHADSEDSDQTGRMSRLICLRWAHPYFVGFVMSRLISRLYSHWKRIAFCSAKFAGLKCVALMPLLMFSPEEVLRGYRGD